MNIAEYTQRREQGIIWIEENAQTGQIELCEQRVDEVTAAKKEPERQAINLRMLAAQKRGILDEWEAMIQCVEEQLQQAKEEIKEHYNKLFLASCAIEEDFIAFAKAQLVVPGALGESPSGGGDVLEPSEYLENCLCPNCIVESCLTKPRD